MSDLVQCSDCLFEGWNEIYADLLPMEFADGETRLTHVVAALSATHRLIDVHVHYFMKGIVGKVDASCTAPCFPVLV